MAYRPWTRPVTHPLEPLVQEGFALSINEGSGPLTPVSVPQMEHVQLPAEEKLLSELRQHTISLWRAILFAFVDLQIGPSLAVSAGYLLVVGGTTSWVAIVIGFALIMSVAEVVRVFSSRYIVTGGLMTYLVRLNARRAGYFVGGANLIGYIALAAGVGTAVTYFSNAVFIDMQWTALTNQATQIATFVIVGLLSVAIALRGLKIASTIAIALGTLCIPFVLWIMIQALIKTPDIDFSSLRPTSASWGAILASVPLVLSSYIGFDGWSFLAAETDNPQRNVPRILNTVVIGSVAILLAVALLQLPLLAGHEDAIGDGTSPIAILADAAGLGGLGTAVDFVLMLATLAAGITVLTYGGRLFAAAASVGVLPRSLAKVSGKSSSPYVAIVTLGAAEIILPIVLAAVVGKNPIEAGIYFSESAAYLWALPYVVSAVYAVIVVLRDPKTAWFSLAAAVVCSLGYTAFMINALSDGWSTADTALPWICTILVLITFVIMMVVDHRREADGPGIEVLDLVD
jgi:amino acid transporter